MLRKSSLSNDSKSSGGLAALPCRSASRGTSLHRASRASLAFARKRSRPPAVRSGSTSSFSTPRPRRPSRSPRPAVLACPPSSSATPPSPRDRSSRSGPPRWQSSRRRLPRCRETPPATLAASDGWSSFPPPISRRSPGCYAPPAQVADLRQQGFLAPPWGQMSLPLACDPGTTWLPVVRWRFFRVGKHGSSPFQGRLV